MKKYISITDALYQLGVVSSEQLKEAVDKSPKCGVSVIDYLLATKVISPKDLGNATAKYYNKTFCCLESLMISPEFINLISKNIATKYRVIPIDKTIDKVILAMTRPDNLEAIDFLMHHLKSDIDIVIVAEDDMEKALRKYYCNKTRPAIIHGELSSDNKERLRPKDFRNKYIVDEKYSLDENIAALSDYVLGDEYKTIPIREQILLSKQLDYMKLYSSILQERISIIEFIIEDMDGIVGYSPTYILSHPVIYLGF